jgi:hypothetical protein
MLRARSAVCRISSVNTFFKIKRRILFFPLNEKAICRNKVFLYYHQLHNDKTQGIYSSEIGEQILMLRTH